MFDLSDPSIAAVRAVFLDLDGTIVGASGRLEPDIVRAIAGARARGARLIACTGRPRAGYAAQIARELDPDAPHIFLGGALAAAPGEDPLFAHPIAAGHALSIVAAARRERLTVELYTPDGVHCDVLTDAIGRHAQLLGIRSIESDLAAIAVDQIVLKAHWIVARADLGRARRASPASCAQTSATSEAMPDVAFLTITEPGVDKGGALREVARQMGLDLAACAAVGDAPGDEPMLAPVGHPFAMGDSPEAMRARWPALPRLEDGGVIGLLDAIARAP